MVQKKVVVFRHEAVDNLMVLRCFVLLGWRLEDESASFIGQEGTQLWSKVVGRMSDAPRPLGVMPDNS